MSSNPCFHFFSANISIILNSNGSKNVTNFLTLFPEIPLHLEIFISSNYNSAINVIMFYIFLSPEPSILVMIVI